MIKKPSSKRKVNPYNVLPESSRSPRSLIEEEESIPHDVSFSKKKRHGKHFLGTMVCSFFLLFILPFFSL